MWWDTENRSSRASNCVAWDQTRCSCLPGAFSQMIKSAPTSLGSDDQAWTRGTGMSRTVLAKSIVATSLAVTRCVLPTTGNEI